jgi:hypothetical protein
MKISDLLKDPNKIKEMLTEAIHTKNKELAEKLLLIINDPWEVYKYAYEIGEKVSDKLEDIIARSSWCSYLYASEILHGPFPKGEDAISQDPSQTYFYVFNVLKKPFPKGEKVLAYNAKASYRYATEILKDRFILGEDMIIATQTFLDNYMKFLEKIGKLDEFLRDHPEIYFQKNRST